MTALASPMASETVEVTLARIEERIIALQRQVSENKKTHETLEKDVVGLKESRARGRGILSVVLLGLGYLGLDRFL